MGGLKWVKRMHTINKGYETGSRVCKIDEIGQRCISLHMGEELWKGTMSIRNAKERKKGTKGYIRLLLL